MSQQLTEVQGEDAEPVRWSPTRELLEHCMEPQREDKDPGGLDIEALQLVADSAKRVAESAFWEDFVRECRAMEEKLIDQYRRGTAGAHKHQSAVRILSVLPKLPDLVQKRLERTLSQAEHRRKLDEYVRRQRGANNQPIQE